MESLVLPNEILLSEVKELLSEGHTVTLRAKGNSMFPFIRGGRDSVVLQKAGRVQTGDIVLACLSGKRYVLHRIRSLNHEQVVLMGDGNVRGMETCRPEDIAGKVLQIIRSGRYIDCSSPAERRKVRIWQCLFPLRRYILAVYRRIHKYSPFSPSTQKAICL
ncbi:MAG: S24/S26 family peptidase [Bacteroidales bacterium]|nr:S24/S26 family peptidase [Bacteroidales bacterium]